MVDLYIEPLDFFLSTNLTEVLISKYPVAWLNPSFITNIKAAMLKEVKFCYKSVLNNLSKLELDMTWIQSFSCGVEFI